MGVGALIWAFVKQPKVLAGIGIVLVLTFGAWKIHDLGKQAGQQSTNQQVVEDDRKAVVSEVTALAKNQAAYEEREKQREAERRAADARANQALQQITALRATIEASRLQVEHIPDEHLLLDIRTKLNIAPDNQEPHFVAGELRAIDQAVTAKPLLEESIKSLTQRVEAIESREKKTQEQLSDAQHQLDAEQQAYKSLLGHYSTVFNAVPRKGRSWKCLWIARCSAAKRLPVPEPAALAK